LKKPLGILAITLAVAAATYGVVRASILINGAGATFPYPIYSKWFDEYTKVDSSARFNYQSIGSGGGIKALKDKTVDFGASDAPLSNEEAAQMPGPVLHFPTVMGAVVLAYNIEGVKQPIRLTGPVIADIFLGKIIKWSDPAITGLNPGITFPDDPIVTAHRSDGSGTTYIFTDYLTKASPEWAAKAGKGKSIKWPNGVGGKGNEGVTGVIQQTPGAIGYVELIYALSNKISFATVKNREGNWVVPSLDGVTAAAAGAASDMPADFRVSITDAPGAQSYPISSFTWILLYKQQTDRTKGEALIKFMKWALADGQKYTAALYYAPIPAPVVEKELAQLSQIVLPAQ
jgi:phosphate transport system substrate-binding protein